MTKKKLKSQVIATFTRQLSLILDSDLSINAGLDIIKSRTKDEKLTKIINSVQFDMREGYSLSEGVAKFEEELTPFVVKMIDLGEQSGSLIIVLDQVADTIEKEIEIREKVKAALAYPLILSVLMLGVIMLLIIKIFPIFNEILLSLGGEMPLFTKIMLSVSSFVSSNILIIIAVIIIIYIGYRLYKNTEKGSYSIDKFKFKMPIQKDIISALMGAKFTRNLLILLNSGFSFSISMEMLKPIMNNKYMSSLLDVAIADLKEGETMSSVIENFDIFPGMMIKLFSVAEKTGHMDKMLEKVSDEMEKEADMKLDNISTVIEPLLIICLSILVGIILISVILPIINILNSIG